MSQDQSPPQMIGQSPAFLDALDRLSAAAPLDRPLLIVGERGAGKELFGARVHFLSRRWDQTFVKINCAALSEDLLESELFGHEAGAFTGATKRLLGRFERADGGTLFLDEIASASHRVQEKILRVIEYGEFERLGGSETLITDVRVVAAANVDLPARAAQNKFRADLLDRLAFDVVTVPPLRARLEDIPLLAAHFGARMAHDLSDDPFPGFTPQAMATLTRHDWPGNIRELKNVVERAVYRHFAGDQTQGAPIDEITLDPFASPYRPGGALTTAPQAETAAETAAPDAPARQPAADFAQAVAAFERDLIAHALAAADHNQKRAAEALNLTYDQLRGLLRKYDLTPRRGGRSRKAAEPV